MRRQQLARRRRKQAVGELHEGTARRHQAEGFRQQSRALGLGPRDQRQAGDDCDRRRAEPRTQSATQIIGIALDDGDARKARPQQVAEARLIFDEEQPLRRDAAREQRLRHHARAGAKLDDWASAAPGRPRRHGRGQRRPGWHDSAEQQRIGRPRSAGIAPHRPGGFAALPRRCQAGSRAASGESSIAAQIRRPGRQRQAKLNAASD